MSSLEPAAPRRRHMAGPRTWALARELYLAGATAAEVAGRLGLTVAAIRQRITREGWSKTAAGDAALPPSQRIAAPASSAPEANPSEERAGDEDAATPDVTRVAHDVARRAARALAAGRAAEAAMLVRAGTQFQAMIRDLPAPPPEPTDEAARIVALWTAHWRTAEHLARALLKDGRVPDLYTRAAFQWRTEHLGAEVAAADKARALCEGWHDQVFDEHGRIRPPEPFETFLPAYLREDRPDWEDE